MLSIGEFARLAGVSVRMLRHYDQLGLLRPERVDPHSGYRRYAAAQLERANQLVALKDLGFTLEQVGVLLDDGTQLSADDIVYSGTVWNLYDKLLDQAGPWAPGPWPGQGAMLHCPGVAHLRTFVQN